MTNNVNIIPALHLYVSFVTISMLMCYLAFSTHCSPTELLSWQQALKWICPHYQEMLETIDKVCHNNHRRKNKCCFQNTVSDRVWTVKSILIGGASHRCLCWFRLSSWVCLKESFWGVINFRPTLDLFCCNIHVRIVLHYQKKKRKKKH